jgi:hypothetical protein
LIETEVDAPGHARIVDVVGDLLEGVVVERQAENGGVRQRDVERKATEQGFGHGPGSVARGRVRRSIARKARRRYE